MQDYEIAKISKFYSHILQRATINDGTENLEWVGSSLTKIRRKWNCFFQRFCDGWSVPSFAEECSHRRRESAISAGTGCWVRFDTLADIYLKSLAQLRQWEVRLHSSTTELPLEFNNKVVKEDWNLQPCQICPWAQSCTSSKPKEGKSVGWIEVLLQSRETIIVQSKCNGVTRVAAQQRTELHDSLKYSSMDLLPL